MLKGTDKLTAMRVGLIGKNGRWKARQGTVPFKRSGTSNNIGKPCVRPVKLNPMSQLVRWLQGSCGMMLVEKLPPKAMLPTLTGPPLGSYGARARLTFRQSSRRGPPARRSAQ
jgi:hypothetical protein